MSLFAVNRFMGDEDDEEERQETAGKAQDILARLQAQAEARRRSKTFQNEDVSAKGKRKHRVSETQVEDDVVKKKKKKKDKDRKNSGSDIVDETDSVTKHKKKKKKVKVKELSEEEDGNEVTKTKKHKKKKRLSKEENDSDSDVSASKVETVTKKHETMDQDEDTDGEEEEQEKKEADPVTMVPLGEGGQEIGGFTVLGDFKKKQKEQVLRVLPDWLSSPDVISADLRHKRLPINEMVGLDPHLVERLAENKISHFFPVQMQVIPQVLKVIKHGWLVGSGGYRPNDICVSAPTGSGKTLAFVLPIVQALKPRVVRRVRAVVVLPVKDLAVQVYKVFQSYVQGTDLKVGLAVGQKTLVSEQQTLVMKKLRGHISLVDIVVATPGRLVDHITNTEGFDLSQLRFLVIDEADRMMDEIKQDWLSILEGTVYNQDGRQQGSISREVPGPLTVANCSRLQIPLQKLLFSGNAVSEPREAAALKTVPASIVYLCCQGNIDEEKRIGRALTGVEEQDRDEKKTSDMADTRGEFIGKFTTPTGLTEYYLRVSGAEKPLVILHFLHQLKFRHVLCFTNSREATHRLYLLVKEFGGVRVQEYSSSLSANKRNKIINDFSANKVDLLICSDAMARGMDVENVKYVISYDTTTHIKTYIHRVGRTARAGKVGTAMTFLENKEVYHFKKMVQEAGKTNVKEMEIDKVALSPMVEQFQVALKKLPQLLMEEKRKKKQKG
ncbi:LOW QUALITY PROTEIN: ATP-dependent RNA helicase DDX51-like [Haliotis rubra]|uniref:LOW QUALITY PROTEIN: ATP-dependent RNA helicase DDX51-like n=1 Tax=Haliotis rubra TaxID=36100 RepID=UPI001EE5CBC5|nr:LOW QUALITY PROTEIN: ATP-dependent RNA helicase DDX51-like [Haliotis rubra]